MTDRNSALSSSIRIALTSLSVSITSYFAATYPTDTLVKAIRNRDRSIVVLLKNNGAFAIVFDANGSFISRNELQTKIGNGQTIELSALPPVAIYYLAQTYPNDVFSKTFPLLKRVSEKVSW